MTDLDAIRARLNSLGIIGPNIIHKEWQPSDHMPEGWEEWEPNVCVCGRVWPCEAQELDDLLHGDDD